MGHRSWTRPVKTVDARSSTHTGRVVKSKMVWKGVEDHVDKKNVSHVNRCNKGWKPFLDDVTGPFFESHDVLKAWIVSNVISLVPTCWSAVTNLELQNILEKFHEAAVLSKFELLLSLLCALCVFLLRKTAGFALFWFSKFIYWCQCKFLHRPPNWQWS